MKNLYVNGCSFTAGHDVEEVKTWPYLLAKKLNLKLLSMLAPKFNFFPIVSPRGGET